MSGTTRILSIDPGNVHSSYVRMDGHRLYGGAKVPNAAMRQVLRDFLRDNPGALVVVEMVTTHGAVVGTTFFEACVMTGRLVQISEDLGGRLRLVYRKEDIYPDPRHPQVFGSTKFTNPWRKSTFDLTQQRSLTRQNPDIAKRLKEVAAREEHEARAQEEQAGE